LNEAVSYQPSAVSRIRAQQLLLIDEIAVDSRP